MSVAKNYLNQEELRALNNLAEQYLIFAEGQATRRIPMAMQDWLTKLDWWFACTQMTVDILAKAGYPQQQVTNLNNAIDTGAFKADLAAVAKLRAASLADADVYTLEKMVAQFADGIARCLGR